MTQRHVQREEKIDRLRSLCRKMSLASFRRLPRQLGWKYDYLDGIARTSPYKLWVTLRLDLPSWKPVSPRRDHGIRWFLPEDAAALEGPFLRAFAQAPEYADYPARRFRKTAADYFGRFLDGARTERSPYSMVASFKGRLIGAALVAQRQRGSLLDCLFVDPVVQQRGWATTMTSLVVDALRQRGETQLFSRVQLANEGSLVWHTSFGFVEVPDIKIALRRAWFYIDRLAEHNRCPILLADEVGRLADQLRQWCAEYKRLEALEQEDFWAANPRLD
jgi:acetyltransferase (GNAT) family protein